MNTWSMVVLIGLLAWPTLAGNDVKPGDHYNDVIEALGQPEGLLKMETSMWLQYDRGTVKLKDNRVVEADLITAEEAAIRREQNALRYVQHVRLLEEERIRRTEEGKRIKESRSNDPYFATLPPEQQVAYWRQFQILYPEVPAQREYQEALTRYQIDRERAMQERARDEKIRELEERLARAEHEREERTRIRYVQARYVYVPTPVYYVQSINPVTCQPVTTTRNYSTSPKNFTYRNRTPGMSLAARLSY